MSVGVRSAPSYVVRWCRHNLEPSLGHVVREAVRGGSEPLDYIRDKVLNTDEKPRTSLYEAQTCAATDLGVAMCAVALACALPSLRVSGRPDARRVLEEAIRGRKGSVLVVRGASLDAAPAGAACQTTMERSPQRCGFYPAAPLHWDLLHGPGQALEDVSSAARHMLAAWGEDAPSVFEVKGGGGDATFAGLLGVVRQRVAQEVADPQEGALPDAWFEGREAREEDKAREQLEWLRGLP